MRRLAIVAMIVAMPYTANADGQGYGLGMHSCAEFAKSYAANPTVTEDLYFTWAQGFMSGLNFVAVADNAPYRFIKGDMRSHKSEIRGYCDAHPLAAYANAVIDLYDSFPPTRPNAN